MTESSVMAPRELKRIFRVGWNDPGRVGSWVERFLYGEFEHAPSRSAWREVLRSAASRTTVRQALDMGTGPGTIAQVWAELGYETRGLDFSKTMIARGREAAARRGLAIEFIEGDVEDPPFEPGTFDLVSSRSVLFTLPAPGYAVRRWASLLRPGGVMVLMGENLPMDPAKLDKQKKLPTRWKPDARYLQALRQLPFVTHTDSMVRVVMQAAGLSDIQSMPMDAVLEARRQHEALDPAYGVSQGVPYVLVGRR